MTDHCGRRSARVVVFRCEHASSNGTHTEHRKIVAGYEMTLRTRSSVGLRISLTHTQAALAAAQRDDVLKRLIVLAQVFVRREGESLPGAGARRVFDGRSLASHVAEEHEFFRFVNRQLLQHDCVNQRKDRGIGANAEREREHGDKREGFALQQPAETIANVFE